MRRVTMLLDRDDTEQGRRNTREKVKRAVTTIKASGLEAFVATFEDGEEKMDVDAFLRDHTGEELKTIISRANYGALAILDVPWQHFSHLRQLRMTKQEVKDEMKQTEGSPEVKGKLRQLQRQFATGRMMEAVPKADVVVVNPTHYAVALKWDDKRMGAPVVVAKGYDAVALRIKEIARDSRVPIVESPPLARVLTATSEIGDEIPPHLYEAVAAVIAYITQLRRWHPARGAMPTYNPVPVIENKDQK